MYDRRRLLARLGGAEQEGHLRSETRSRISRTNVGAHILGVSLTRIARTSTVISRVTMTTPTWPCVAIMLIWSILCAMIIWTCVYFVVVLSCFYVVVVLLRIVVGRQLQ